MHTVFFIVVRVSQVYHLEPFLYLQSLLLLFSLRFTKNQQELKDKTSNQLIFIEATIVTQLRKLDIQILCLSSFFFLEEVLL